LREDAVLQVECVALACVTRCDQRFGEDLTLRLRAGVFRGRDLLRSAMSTPCACMQNRRVADLFLKRCAEPPRRYGVVEAWRANASAAYAREAGARAIPR